MRIHRLIGVLVLTAALGLVAVATAAAEETRWQWLPGSEGETFTGKTGKIVFQQEGGARIECTKSKITLPNSSFTEFTEKKDAKGALAVIDLEGCGAFGLPIFSEGDGPSGTILAHVEIRNCMIKKEHFGLLVKFLPIHLEIKVPALLINLEGSFVALIEPLPKDELKNHFILNITQKEGLQTIEKCEGGEKETLKSKVDSGEFKELAIEASEGLILFDRAVDSAGETMMEK